MSRTDEGGEESTELDLYWTGLGEAINYSFKWKKTVPFFLKNCHFVE